MTFVVMEGSLPAHDGVTTWQFLPTTTTRQPTCSLRLTDGTAPTRMRGPSQEGRASPSDAAVVPDAVTDVEMGSSEPRPLSDAPITAVGVDSGVLFPLATAPLDLPSTFLEGEQAPVELPSQEGADAMDIDPAASSKSPPRSTDPESAPKRTRVSELVEDEEQVYRAWRNDLILPRRFFQMTGASPKGFTSSSWVGSQAPESKPLAPFCAQPLNPMARPLEWSTTNTVMLLPRPARRARQP